MKVSGSSVSAASALASHGCGPLEQATSWHCAGALVRSGFFQALALTHLLSVDGYCIKPFSFNK